MPVRSKYHAALVQRRWQRVRRLVLARDRTCRECGKYGVLEVDHRIPLHLGGEAYDLANLQVLCRHCHIRKTARENSRPLDPEREKWRVLVAEQMKE